PKLDFLANDSIGREWQVATIQLDMNMPERFDLACTNEKGEEERIVMIHAAIMGSLERFMSILIEHVAGQFPTWLSPVQVTIIPVSDKHHEYAQGLADVLTNAGVRADIDTSSDMIGKKIRAWKVEKIPYAIVVGDKEIEANNITLETRNGAKHETTIEAFAETVAKEIADRAPELSL
ncbi:threonine--tRNA ligase, partial [Patescibacteria group bacterium]|nr:threonine--tRNA ligase [Patescibacteria group bacterium]